MACMWTTKVQNWGRGLFLFSCDSSVDLASIAVPRMSSEVEDSALELEKFNDHILPVPAVAATPAVAGFGRAACVVSPLLSFLAAVSVLNPFVPGRVPLNSSLSEDVVEALVCVCGDVADALLL